MTTTLHLQHHVQTRIEPTDRAMQIAVMFGLSLDGTREHVIIPPTEITLLPGQIVFITGVSGGGKSTLLRLIDSAIHTDNAPGLVWADKLPALPCKALVEALALPEVDADFAPEPAGLDQVCRWLSLSGLNDAAVMLRRPAELSEGQRHRLRLAQAIAVTERRQEPWSLLLADEFGSTLDRTTAHAIARSVRRWVSQSNLCLVAATAHDDLLEPLAPDVLVQVGPGGQCDVYRR